MKKTMLFLFALAVMAICVPVCIFADDAPDPFFVTADNIDPHYATPVIDREEDVEAPIKGHIVVGHFEETSGSKFTFFFPSKEYGEDSEYHWEGRFYHSVYPGTKGDVSDRNVIMNALCGAYTIADATPEGGGYRSSAAAAKLSREYAAKYYGYDQHIYGYVYGGSGGGFVTTGCIEGTEGVYDGAVPYVVSTRTGLPYNQCSRVFARAVFKDSAPRIAEALEVGGSGDPYETLSEGEAALFKMLTDYGVPLEVWKNYGRYLEITPSTYVDTAGTAAAGIPTSGLMELCRYAIKKDPTYWDEFWTNPVYLGAGDSAEAKLIQSLAYTEDCVIQKIVPDAKGQPGQLRLDKIAVDPLGVGLRYELCTADGTVIGTIDGTMNTKKKAFDVDFNYDDSIFPEKGTSKDVWSQIQEGMIIRASNKKNLAMVCVFMYHLPVDDGELNKNAYHVVQFLNPDGSLPDSYRPSNRDWMSDNTQGKQKADGDIGSEKIVLVGCMSDMEAYMGSAYYDLNLQDSLADEYDDHVRIWWFDNADHMDSALSTSPQYFIAYSGGLIEAMNEVAAWVEQGIEPSTSTSYSIEGGQVVIADGTATDRGGIQPTVDTMTANGAEVEKIVIRAGDTVDFTASFTLSEKTGNLSAVRWDYVGYGNYEDDPNPGLSVKGSHTYNEPGIYMAAVKVDSQSDKFLGTTYGISQNFRKIRVVVEPTLVTKENVVTFYGNDKADESMGQIYGAKRYYPVSWTADGKSGEFTANGSVYTAECDGYGEGVVTCEVQVWTGYRWETSENETFKITLPKAPDAAAEPAATPSPAPVPAAQQAKSSGSSAWIFICIAIVAIAAIAVVVFKKRKK